MVRLTWLFVFVIQVLINFEILHTAPKYGKLFITTIPSEAIVMIDGKAVGKTPLQYSKITYGKHTLRLKLGKYESIESVIRISRKNSCLTLHYPLALMKVTGSPENAVVKLGDSPIGRLPTPKMLIPYGNHTLSVEKSGFRTFKDNYFLVNNQTFYQKQVKLSQISFKKSLIFSSLLPGSGQYYSGRKRMGALLGIASAGSIFFSINRNSAYSKAKEEFVNSDKLYHENTDVALMDSLYETMNNNYNTMKKNHNLTRIMVGVTAVIWLYNMFDVYYFFPKVSKMNLGLNYQQGQPIMTMNIHF